MVFIVKIDAQMRRNGVAESGTILYLFLWFQSTLILAAIAFAIDTPLISQFAYIKRHRLWLNRIFPIIAMRHVNGIFRTMANNIRSIRIACDIRPGQFNRW